MRIKRSWLLSITSQWQPIAIGLIVTILVGGLLLFRLGTLTPGVSQHELEAHNASRSYSQIVKNPLYAPHKVMQRVFFSVIPNKVVALRLASVIVGAAFIYLFYYILSRWFDNWIAALGTTLFATSSWFLHVARSGTTTIMLLSLIAAVGYGTWLRKKRRSYLALVGCVAVCIWLLYTPGLILFVLLGAIWQRNQLRTFVDANPFMASAAGLCIVASIGPLIYAISKDSSLAKQYIGLTTTSFDSISVIVQRFLFVPIRLVIRGPADPSTNVGRMPLVDFFVSIMCVLGIYSYLLHLKLDRARALSGGILLSWILIGLGLADNALLLPFVYLLASGGIAFMISHWFKVFPINPFARSLAIVIMSLAITATAYYNLSNYFVAWPQAPATKQAVTYLLH